MSRWADRIEAELGEVRASGRWRLTRSFDALGPLGELDGRSVVSFGGNDYLGLSRHPAVIDAATKATERWGAGSTGARLLVGTRPVHHELEDALATWKGTERALVFSTGYQANLGVLSALAGPDTTILSDELNHASIIDGCRLSRARTRVIGHRDISELEATLEELDGPAIVVTDTVFSMDGDLVDIAALMEVCGRHDAMLVIDEAHAVLGPTVDVAAAPCELVRVGTLSKTLGSMGGFVAASAPVIDLLVNRARAFIFTTALSPADAAAALAALGVLATSEGEALTRRLRSNVERLRPAHPSPIIPLVIGGEQDALDAAKQLLEHGVYVPAVRPPTVPVGTSRLRVAVSAAHDDEMIGRLLEGLEAVGIGR